MCMTMQRRKHSLLYYIGDEAYDIFDSFSDEQKGSENEGEANQYETLKHSFITYFTPKLNSIDEILQISTGEINARRND